LPDCSSRSGQKEKTPEEVAGFAQAMRDKSIRIASDKIILSMFAVPAAMVQNTFNISTGSCFL